MDNVAYEVLFFFFAVFRFSWFQENKGITTTNDLEVENNISPCISIISLCIYVFGETWLYLCKCVIVVNAGTAEQDSAEYLMHLTSPHGWSLLLGINHGDLWQASRTVVIHGTAFMTFHSGTQLSPLA